MNARPTPHPIPHPIPALLAVLLLSSQGIGHAAESATATAPAPFPGANAVATTAIAPTSAAALAEREAYLAHDELGDAWIDSVYVDLWPDVDGDGFASGLSVEIDADTVRGAHDVFARLSLTGSDTFERLIHDSSDFTITDRSGSDRIEVEFDLLTEYPTDYYELVIELRDARENRLLDVVDGGVLYDLSGLALEDARRDGRLRDDPVHTPHAGHDPHHDNGYHDDGYSVAYTVGYTSYDHGYGGSSYAAAEYAGAGGPLALLALGGLALLRRGRG